MKNNQAILPKSNFLGGSAYFSFSDFKPINFPDYELNIDEELTVQGILVKEIGGKTLYERNSNSTFAIASITKLLSSYLALEIFSPDQILIFNSKAVNQPGEVGFFQVGEKVKVIDLVKASLVASSNDSIFLISDSYGEQEFLKLLNEKLKKWGLKKTVIVDPMGLSPQNVSTPEELYEIIFKILATNPEIFYLTNLEKIVINGKTLWSTNLLLPKYRKIIVGGKTGYTEEAGECLVLVLKFPSSPYLTLIILNSQNRFKDAEILIRALAKYYNYEL